MSKDRISEEELKTDQFLQFVGKFIEYYKNNKLVFQWIAIGVVSLVVIAVLFGQYKSSRHKKALNAFENATTVVAINDFLDKYKGSALYPLALYKKGNTLYGEKNYDGAIEAYSQIISKYPKSAVADQTFVAAAYTYMALNKYDDAKNHLEKMLADYTGSPFANQAIFNLARCYMKLSDYKKALEIAEKIIKDDPSSLFAAEVKKIMPEIKRNL